MTDRHAQPLPEPAPGRAPRGRTWTAGYLGASALCAAAAALAWSLHWVLNTASLVLIFLLAVVLTAARFGRGPATVASGLGVVLFNLMFVPPRMSFAVADEQFFFTFAVMLAVGLMVGQLTAGLRAQADAALERERRVRSLYEISRELGNALTPEQVAEVAARFVDTHLAARLTLWVGDRSDQPVAYGEPAAPAEAARARALMREPGRAGDTRPAPGGAGCMLLPLRATMAVRGALAARRPQALAWTEEDRQVLQTCASLLAGALERIHYIDVAQTTALEIEGERLRNSLLAAISHDLRTPLSSMVGLAESLGLTKPAPTAQQREIGQAMAASARRMSALVGNLLDMARLQSGAVRLNRQWQPLEEVTGTAVAAVSGAKPAARQIRIDLPEDLPLLHIDAVLMERVLVNLLENALKYTPEGSPVEISAQARPDAVEIVVRDHGPGVPSGRETDVFRKFERGRRESSTSGVGLGLALCQSIVHAHGGTIRAENAADGGARLVMRLPLGDPPPLPAGDVSGKEPAP